MIISSNNLKLGAEKWQHIFMSEFSEKLKFAFFFLQILEKQEKHQIQMAEKLHYKKKMFFCFFNSDFSFIIY